MTISSFWQFGVADDVVDRRVRRRLLGKHAARWNNHWQAVYAETGRNPQPLDSPTPTVRYRPDDGLRPSHTFIPSYAWGQSPWRRDRTTRPGGKRR